MWTPTSTRCRRAGIPSHSQAAAGACPSSVNCETPRQPGGLDWAQLGAEPGGWCQARRVAERAAVALLERSCHTDTASATLLHTLCWGGGGHRPPANKPVSWWIFPWSRLPQEKWSQSPFPTFWEGNLNGLQGHQHPLHRTQPARELRTIEQLQTGG